MRSSRSRSHSLEKDVRPFFVASVDTRGARRPGKEKKKSNERRKKNDGRTDRVADTAQGISESAKVIYAFFAYLFGGLYLVLYLIFNRGRCRCTPIPEAVPIGM